MIIAFGNPVYDHISTPRATTGQRVLSGCSTNACLALARLGHATALVGRVGADYHTRLLSDARRYGIEPHLQLCDQTGGFALVYDERGQRTLDVLGVAAPIAQVPPGCADAAALIIGPILQETPLALVERIRAASDAPLFLDPQGLLRQIAPDGRIVHFHPEWFRAVAGLCQVLKANEVETAVLTGIDPRADAPAAARRLWQLGSPIAIVTLAEAGSLIDDGQRQYRIPAYPTDALDPTGAGDTYLAGFIDAYLRQPHDLYAAGCYAAATASIWIEHTGPDAPIVAAEVQRRASALLASRAL